MHDPMVVAFEIRRPWPKRNRWHDAKPGKPRWKVRYDHATWRHPFRDWMCFWTVAGAGLYWPSLITIWHVEPNGRDALEVCSRRYQDGDGKWRRSRGWKWHVWHWHVQISPSQKLKRWLFERCIECGRRYPWSYAPVAHQWDGPGPRWRPQKVNYHHECSSLVMTRRTLEQSESVVRKLAAEVRVRSDESEPDLVERLNRAEGWEHWERYRLQNILGYERDDDYQLVKKGDAAHG